VGRLAGFDTREVRRVAESVGWRYVRTTGDHLLYERAGERQKLSIPNHRPIREGTMNQLVKKMGLSVDEFLRLARK